MLNVDIPTLQEFKHLSKQRADACVSIYLPTTPLTQDVGMSQTQLGNLSKQAFGQLEEAGFDKRRLAGMRERMDDLLEDDEFWRFQATSVAVLVTPDDMRTFRLANHLQDSVEVSDRFHLKPLLRALTFPHTAFVLALSENAVRLIEVSADREAQEIPVQALPKDAASALHKSTLNDRSHSRRIHGSEGQKVRLAQYSRIVDRAIRPILAGLDVPLILAASEPLASIYRSVNSYPGLLKQNIAHTDDRTSNADLAAAATPVLDGRYAEDLASIRQDFDARMDSGRALTDLAGVARAATFGAIETLLVDIDAAAAGTLDETSGALALAEADTAQYDVLDEIAGRALNSGARVLGVRSMDIPGGGHVAALLRYAV